MFLCVRQVSTVEATPLFVFGQCSSATRRQRISDPAPSNVYGLEFVVPTWERIFAGGTFPPNRGSRDETLCSPSWQLLLLVYHEIAIRSARVGTGTVFRYGTPRVVQ